MRVQALLRDGFMTGSWVTQQRQGQQLVAALLFLLQAGMMEIPWTLLLS